MKKLLYAKDSVELWGIFNQEREKRQRRLTKLPFARKAAILNKMRVYNYTVIFEPVKEGGYNIVVPDWGYGLRELLVRGTEFGSAGLK